MPGTIPTKIIVPHTGDGIAAPDSAADWFDQHHQSAKTPVEHEPPVPGRHLFNFSFDTPPFPWARTEPFIYVQQVVLRTQVVPWPAGEMQLSDAFRAPLHEIFRLLETVSNHEHAATQTTLPRLCLHVENVKRREQATVFPEYNCLVLSPANLWQQSVHTFNKDVSLLATIFHHHVSEPVWHSIDRTQSNDVDVSFPLRRISKSLRCPPQKCCSACSCATPASSAIRFACGRASSSTPSRWCCDTMTRPSLARCARN